jgi:hypothetical protein
MNHENDGGVGIRRPNRRPPRARSNIRFAGEGAAVVVADLNEEDGA